MSDDEKEIAPPISLAMILCDNIHIDPGTGKRTLLGLFSVVGSTAYPFRHPFMSVYISLTECRKPSKIKLRMIDVDEEHEPIFQLEGELPTSDPLMVNELQFGLAGIEFPRPGEYRVQLFASGQIVAERRLVAVEPRQIQGEQ